MARAPSSNVRFAALLIALAAGLSFGCIAEVDEDVELDEEVGESGYLLIVDGIPGGESDAPAQDELELPAPPTTLVEGPVDETPDPEGDAADPSNHDWLLDPEPSPWGDPNRGAVHVGPGQPLSD